MLSSKRTVAHVQCRRTILNVCDVRACLREADREVPFAAACVAMGVSVSPNDSPEVKKQAVNAIMGWVRLGNLRYNKGNHAQFG